MPHPAPTAAPLVARNLNGRHQKVRIRDEILQAAKDEDGNEDIILGPFQARSNRDISALRREIGTEEEDLRNGQAYSNAKEWVRRQERKRDMYKRQTAAEQACFVGNYQLSCYPTSGTHIQQDTYGKFIWNTNYPEFTNNGGLVDIYLFHQDKDTIVTTWSGVPNTQGRLSFQPQDSWWQGNDVADNFNGTDISWPFYFVITYSGKGLGGATTRLSTWYGVQTALPARVAASRSSASISSASLSSAADAASKSAATLTGSSALALSSLRGAESASFAASLTSVLIASLTAQGLHGTQTLKSTATATLTDGFVVTATATGRADGFIIPPYEHSNDLPGYAIALIVVFGLLVLLGALFGLYFILAASRRRRNRDDSGEDMQSISKMGSTTPMMRTSRDFTYQDEPTSPTGEAEEGGISRSISHLESNSRQDIPFSNNEASRMADAFRAALREPTFENLAESTEGEGSKRKTLLSINETSSESSSPAAIQLMKDELKAGGQDLRQVQERKKPEIIP